MDAKEVWLSKPAEKIDRSDLVAFLAERNDVPELGLWIFYCYLEKAFTQVSSQWLNVFKESPLSDVPLSHIPKSVYKISADWIKKLKTDRHPDFVMWLLDRILIDWAAHQAGAQPTSSKPQVAAFVALAMVLRSKPNALTFILRMLRDRPRYQGEDKLPVIVWMMAQASQGDLSAGLYSWALNLLPLVGSNNCYSPQSMDLILQFVEMILSNPEAWNILVNEAVWEGKRLIPPSSFEILVRLTFPASSSRVEATRRFEAIYPLLKEVALAPGRKAMKKIFTFSLKLAGEGVGSSVLAKEAIEIALCCVTKNVDCFKQWDILYKENIEASVALLKKLVDEWKNHFLKLSSSPNGTLTVNDTIYRFMIKNEEAMTEGVANGFLYKEADFICHLILKKLPFCRGSKSSRRSYRPKKKSKLLKQ